MSQLSDYDPKFLHCLRVKMSHKLKFLSQGFFLQRPISIFPYVNQRQNKGKIGTFYTVNCLKWIRNASNSLCLDTNFNRMLDLQVQTTSSAGGATITNLIFFSTLSLADTTGYKLRTEIACLDQLDSTQFCCKQSGGVTLSLSSFNFYFHQRYCKREQKMVRLFG